MYKLALPASVNLCHIARSIRDHRSQTKQPPNERTSQHPKHKQRQCEPEREAASTSPQPQSQHLRQRHPRVIRGKTACDDINGTNLSSSSKPSVADNTHPKGSRNHNHTFDPGGININKRKLVYDPGGNTLNSKGDSMRDDGTDASSSSGNVSCLADIRHNFDCDHDKTTLMASDVDATPPIESYRVCVYMLKTVSSYSCN